MEILGVGFPELVFILIVAILVLGPKDMQKAGLTIGKWLRAIVTSDGWRIFQQTSRELRGLPNRLMREANEDLEKIGQDINNRIEPRTAVVSNEPARSVPAPIKKIEPPNKAKAEVAEEKEAESDPEKDA